MNTRDAFRQYRDRIGELEEEVRQLRALLDERALQQWPSAWRLSPMEARLLSLIVTAPGNLATKQYIYASLYRECHPDRQPDGKILDVMLCKIRKKLPADQASRIVTHWGVGWSWVKKDPVAE